MNKNKRIEVRDPYPATFWLPPIAGCVLLRARALCSPSHSISSGDAQEEGGASEAGGGDAEEDNFINLVVDMVCAGTLCHLAQWL